MTSNNHQTPAFRTTRIAFLVATAACALLAAAAPANALPGLPIAVPTVQQSVATPAGSIDASAGEQGASFCSDLYTPSLPPLPAVPALPLPMQVPIPAVPTTAANANLCASAGLDGASADAGIDSAVAHAHTGVDAQSPVSVGEVEGLAGETAGHATGFFESLYNALFGWM
jgi:hypothetical protein